MTSLTVLAAALIAGLVFGFIGHELAHWAVLKVFGLDDGLTLWPPRVGFHLRRPIPFGARAAAVAPAVVGVALFPVALLLGVEAVAFAAGAIPRFLALSQADRDVAAGRVPANAHR